MTNTLPRSELGFVEVKSKFHAEFRRFSIDGSQLSTYESFRTHLSKLHSLSEDDPKQTFHVFYVDPKDDDLLPITNTENYRRALQCARPLLRLVILSHGECEQDFYKRNIISSNMTVGGTSLLTSMLGGAPKPSKSVIPISMPTEFRQVSAIIDVDVVPDSCRRVRLLKHGSDKPLGFYIRDGTSVRVTTHGLEKVPGIFISRLLAGGLAESTGLLAVNDEVLEVNGIEVAGKTLDQVTDMMVANSSNLIVTVRPANQRATLTSSASLSGPRRGSFSRNSNMSQDSLLSRTSSTQSRGSGGAAPHGRGFSEVGYSLSGAAGNTNYSDSGEPDDEDEVRDMTSGQLINLAGSNGVERNSNGLKQVLHL